MQFCVPADPSPLTSQRSPEVYLFFSRLQKQEVTFQVITDLLWAHGWSLCIVPVFLFELGGSGQRDGGRALLLWLQPTLLRGRVMKTYPNPCQRLARNIWHLTYNNKQKLKVKSHTAQAFGKRICLCHELLLDCKGVVWDSRTGSELSERYTGHGVTICQHAKHRFIFKYIYIFISKCPFQLCGCSDG